MREIRWKWVCRNIHFNEIYIVELTDESLLKGNYPSWITSDNCEIIAKILPTGKQDRNGKEIWEGDRLCIMGHKDMSGQVIWDNSGFVILWDKCRARKKVIGNDREPIFHNCNVSLEVIDNIYSNPEVLELKKAGGE